MLKGKELQAACELALAEAAELLNIGWCAGNWARNKDKQSVEPWAEDACEWCIEGALIAVTHQKYDNETAKQIQQYCVALIQTGNPDFAPAVIKNGFKMQIGRITGPTQIHKGSVIPSLNDSLHTTKEMVVHWVKVGLKLAGMASFK